MPGVSGRCPEAERARGAPEARRPRGARCSKRRPCWRATRAGAGTRGWLGTGWVNVLGGGAAGTLRPARLGDLVAQVGLGNKGQRARRASLAAPGRRPRLLPVLLLVSEHLSPPLTTV